MPRTLAEDSDSQAVNDGLDVPAEIARREQRLAALAQAKEKIKQRAAERHAVQQQEHEAKCAKRQALREAGKKPRGPEPEAPSSEPRASDQVNLTEEQSRIMPSSSGGFEQSYNAQAAVDTATMLVLTAHVTQAPNDMRQIVPMLAMKRESHHIAVRERFAQDAPAPETNDPKVKMAHRLGTQTGRAMYRLRKQTVEPVFGIIKRVMGRRQMSMRGLDKARGEWPLVTMAWNIKRLHVLRAT